MVYNGDEVSALVVDFGSHTTRAGYAGEDCPRVVCPSFYGYLESQAPASTSNGGSEDVVMSEGNDTRKKGSGRTYFVGEDGVNVWREGMEVENFMLDGIVHDAEPAAELLHHILHKRLSVNPSEHPIMLTEPAWNTLSAREKVTEMVFEGEGVPAMYMGSAGVLSAFAAGKPSALVLDVGYGNSSAVPVVDGYALRAGTKRQPLASQLVTSQLHAHFTHPTHLRPFPLPLIPRHLISKRTPAPPAPSPPTRPQPILRDDRVPGTTASWSKWAQNQIIENWREACGEVVNYRRFDFRTAGEMPGIEWEFPDGYSQTFGEERYRFQEILFDPKNYFNQSVEPPVELRTVQTGPQSHSLKDLVPLSQLVHDSIMACDVDVRASLLQNIVIVGNTSLTRGLTERLDTELAALLPSQKIKIHSPTIPFERKYSSWLGGSILASLGTFHQLWVTKDEYEEHGAAIVHQRCK